ncbi:MAG: GrpB family protein, partial [Actinobacteria bacterium]
MSEEEIRAVTVGEPVAVNGPVALAEYDPAWPQRFRQEEDRIRAALETRVLRLEHTGSTSVPGLAAKPIIDIVAVVADPADEASYVPALEAAGYVLRIREPGWHEHRALVRRRELGHGYDVNLHVHPPGSDEIAREVTFRDWLRTHPGDRALYEATKRELAARDWRYVQNYADAKTEVVEQI